MAKEKQPKLFAASVAGVRMTVKAWTRGQAFQWVADKQISVREIGAVEATGIEAKDINDATQAE